MQGCILAAAFELILCPEKGIEAHGLVFAVALTVHLLLWRTLSSPKAFGSLARYSTHVNVLLLSCLCALAMKPNPVRGGLYAAAAVLLWPASFLTAQPWLCLHGAGFLCALAQGVAHRLAGEASTVEQLQDLGPDEKLPYEWAHHTFFPNLLLHAVHKKMA